nr:PEP-CTERM sorting domain-containing protein [uncultured Desulfobulbus sp.]
MPIPVVSLLVSLLLNVCVFTSIASADSLRVEGEIVIEETTGLYWTRSAVSSTPLTYSKALEWVAWLRDTAYGGYTDWHLPRTPDGDWGNGNIYDGQVNASKYNVDVSDIGHLYYVSIGLTSQYKQSGNSQDDINKLASRWFENLIPACYWFETLASEEINGAETGWGFDFGWGSQFKLNTSNVAYAIAVRSAVPEPSVAGLFMTALLSFTFVRTRRKTH